ncbi:MAG: hypothetical protein BGP12_17505 [Rhodospirillales bacterium 70-18]|nr:hypothetical protein [Rhodospirillales bacterium]OJY65654.1 MAG: hypothetical protein BGP12_17505 [Rhodospirillales bacterium 70-18]
MPFDAPFTLGPFTVDDRGRLLPTDTGRFPAFTVRWRNRAVEVSLARPVTSPAAGHGGMRGVIAMRTLAGRVPSTAEHVPDQAMARRAAVFAALVGMTPLLPAGWRMELLADHSVALTAEAELEMPATATALVSDVTLFLLAAAPYLDLLDESGVGTVNTCPG